MNWKEKRDAIFKKCHSLFADKAIINHISYLYYITGEQMLIDADVNDSEFVNKMVDLFFEGIDRLKGIKLCSKTDVILHCYLPEESDINHNNVNPKDNDGRIVLNNYIRRMGFYDDKTDIIYICPEAIEECARKSALNKNKLTEMVALHELGHCVSAEYLPEWTRKEQEQFADYFASYCSKNELDDYISIISAKVGCVCPEYAYPLFYRKSKDDSIIEGRLRK